MLHENANENSELQEEPKVGGLETDLDYVADSVELLKDILQGFRDLSDSAIQLVTFNVDSRAAGNTIKLGASPQSSDVLLDLVAALRAREPNLMVVKLGDPRPPWYFGQPIDIEVFSMRVILPFSLRSMGTH